MASSSEQSCQSNPGSRGRSLGDAPAETTTTEHSGHGNGATDPADLVAAALANAAFQDVAMAEAAGYGSTMEGLGCFGSAELGGMGLHYLNGDLLDDEVDIRTPEALVYELDANGEIAALVAHEYIVPVNAWTSQEPPNLFGIDFHQHPVLPRGCSTCGSGKTTRPACSRTSTRRCGWAMRVFPSSA